jgi:hypothetical protein
MILAIHLTQQQREALAARQGQAVEVIDPVTNRVYVLVAAETYERMRDVRGGEPVSNELSGARQPAAAAGTESSQPPVEIPPGIRRSQEAFWRDLPQLLAQKKLRGRWILYHGDQRVGIARTAEELIQVCIRRDLGDDACYLAAIAPRAVAPWEVEEIAPPKHGYGPVDLHDGAGAGTCAQP